MKLNITRGPKHRPQKVCIYAPEGIGKSTLASQLPRPLFLDFEQGSHHLNVDRVEPATFTETLGILSELAKNSQGYETLVLDTIDWCEEAAVRDLCLKHKKTGIEDFGYGKGYAFLAEEMLVLLSRLDAVSRHMNVVLLAHSEVKRVELPDLPAFDRYQLRLSKTVMPLVKEWADALLFGNYKLILREPDGGRVKAQGGRERILNCQHSAAADAKNRHGLKEVEPWSTDTLARILAAPKTAPIQQPTPTAEPAGQVVEPEDHVPGLEGADADPLWERLEPHRQAVQAWLVANGRIQAGEGFEEMDSGTRSRIKAAPEKFLAVVTAQAKEAA